LTSGSSGVKLTPFLARMMVMDILSTPSKYDVGNGQEFAHRSITLLLPLQEPRWMMTSGSMPRSSAVSWATLFTSSSKLMGRSMSTKCAPLIK
jgi:hypothetical protein